MKKPKHIKVTFVREYVIPMEMIELFEKQLNMPHLFTSKEQRWAEAAKHVGTEYLLNDVEEFTTVEDFATINTQFFY